MKITILYFAALREALGTERESVDVPVEVQTASELRTWLARRLRRVARFAWRSIENLPIQRRRFQRAPR